MRYVSTRGAAPELGFTDALLAGLATDGGLWGRPQQARAMEILAGLSAADADLEPLHDAGLLAAALAVVGDRGLFGWGGHLAAMRAVLHLGRGRSGRLMSTAGSTTLFRSFSEYLVGGARRMLSASSRKIWKKSPRPSR